MANNQLDKVCTHPPVPSDPSQIAAKCALCMKPLGKGAMVTKQGKSFCCDAAADQYFASDAHYQAYKAKEGKGFLGKLIKLIVVLAILGGIAYAAYMNKDKIMEMIGKGKPAPAETSGN